MNNKLIIGAAAAAVGIYFLTKKKGTNTNAQNEKPVQGVSGFPDIDKQELYRDAVRLAGKIDENSYDLMTILEISGAKQSTIDDLEEMGRTYGNAIHKEIKKMKGGRK